MSSNALWFDQVQKFLGFTNYYRKFLYRYAQIAKPLNQLVSRGNAKRKRAKVEWNEEYEKAFQTLKNLCSNTPCLAYPDYERKFKLYTDASEQGLGAVLTQLQDGGVKRPIAYASHTLSKSECNYNAHKLEFLALKWAVMDRFHEYLYGGTFDVFTDNNPLTYILTSAKLDAIGQRWVASLAPYNFSLHYNLGWQNVVADSLSRIPWENAAFEDCLDFNVVKAVINKGEVNSLAMIDPELLRDGIQIQMKQVVDSLAGKLTKVQWRLEQSSDPEIGPIVKLIHAGTLLQYQVEKSDNPGSKVLLHFRDNL